MKKWLIVSLVFSLINIGITQAIYFPIGQSHIKQIGGSLNIEIQYDIVLEYFLAKIAQGNIKRAYEILSESFKLNTSFKNFKIILRESGLLNYKKRRWTLAATPSSPIPPLFVNVTGEFIKDDDTVHIIDLELMKDDIEYIRINNISEKINVETLADRFPHKKNLIKLIKKNITKIVKLIKQHKAYGLYSYLSEKGRAKIKMKDIKKMVGQFKKTNNDISLSNEAEIILTDRSPYINEQGQMVTEGSYKNHGNIINFILIYDYDWQWKLGAFSLTVTPLII